MSRITKIVNHLREELIADNAIITKNTMIKYKNEFDEEFILLPIYYPNSEGIRGKIYERKAVFINDLRKLDSTVKIDDFIIDGEFTHDDWVKPSLYYFVNNKNEDYISIYEIDLAKDTGA